MGRCSEPRANGIGNEWKQSAGSLTDFKDLNRTSWSSPVGMDVEFVLKGKDSRMSKGIRAEPKVKKACI